MTKAEQQRQTNFAELALERDVAQTALAGLGTQGRQREVIVLLFAAGARVEPKSLESEKVRSNPAILTTLRGGML